MRILVSGATGYVGSRLIPRLVDSGHEVSCMVRNASRLDPRVAESTRIVVADVLQPESVAAAMQGIEVAYYLIHSMSASGGDFQERDRLAAHNFAVAARQAGVNRIIYLGGLASETSQISAHLDEVLDLADQSMYRAKFQRVPLSEPHLPVLVSILDVPSILRLRSGATTSTLFQSRTVLLHRRRGRQRTRFDSAMLMALTPAYVRSYSAQQLELVDIMAGVNRMLPADLEEKPICHVADGPGGCVEPYSFLRKRRSCARFRAG